MEVFCLCFSFISTSELIQSILTRSHYIHPDAVSLNNSAGVEGKETMWERLFEAQFGLVAVKQAESHCEGEL